MCDGQCHNNHVDEIFAATMPNKHRGNNAASEVVVRFIAAIFFVLRPTELLLVGRVVRVAEEHPGTALHRTLL